MTESSQAEAGAPGTGDARVDGALERLADLDGLPVTEHVPVYDEVNRLLQDALADLDEEQ
ncbi:MAG: hypothetical protein QOJ92_970 [Frankiales bacterium]|nr:hypothetical protein [Frankiales bacterium]MDX6273760.1 hypothetical protein [Frankiales bacterium]